MISEQPEASSSFIPSCAQSTRNKAHYHQYLDEQSSIREGDRLFMLTEEGILESSLVTTFIVSIVDTTGPLS